MILRKCLHFQIGRDMVLAAVTWKTYVKVVFVMFLIYLIALAATRDIATDFDITNAAVRRIRKEKVPQKFVSVFWIIGEKSIADKGPDTGRALSGNAQKP